MEIRKELQNDKYKFKIDINKWKTKKKYEVKIFLFASNIKMTWLPVNLPLPQI